MCNTAGDSLHDVGYLFHIGYQLGIGAFDFFNCVINYLNMSAELCGIRCDLIYIFTGLCYLFQSDLNQLQGLFNGSGHLSGSSIQTGQSFSDLSGGSVGFST